MKRSSAVPWPDDLHLVFAAVGEAMGEGRLRPELLAALPAGVGAILPGHRVIVTHVPKTVSGHKHGHYLIEANGERWGASPRESWSGWLVTHGKSTPIDVRTDPLPTGILGFVRTIQPRSGRR